MVIFLDNCRINFKFGEKRKAKKKNNNNYKKQKRKEKVKSFKEKYSAQNAELAVKFQKPLRTAYSCKKKFKHHRVTHFRTNLRCVGREPNPGLPNGRRELYHRTTNGDEAVGCSKIVNWRETHIYHWWKDDVLNFTKEYWYQQESWIVLLNGT